MKLLLLQPPERPAQLVALFGVGLLGSSILRALRSLSLSQEETVPLGWELDTPAGAQALGALRQRARALSEGHPELELSLVWSAGRAGPSAASTQTERELANYLAVLDWAEALGEELERPLRVHLVSSAGGIFAGCGLVTRSPQPPAPRHPYGELKLRQEEALAGRGWLGAQVYRPTSVYGFLHPEHRRGLIQTLLAQGVRRRVTTIYGRLSTLRDFVFSEDVGAYLARRVCEPPPPGATTYLLASGRPSSLREVIHAVERILGKRLFIAFVPPTSAEDLCYHANALPSDWRPLDLLSGLRQLYTRWTLEGYSES